MALTPLNPETMRLLLGHWIEILLQDGVIGADRAKTQEETLLSLPATGLPALILAYQTTAEWAYAEEAAWRRVAGADYLVSLPIVGDGGGGGGGDGNGNGGDKVVGGIALSALLIIAGAARIIPWLIRVTPTAVRLPALAWAKMPVDLRNSLLAIGASELYETLFEAESEEELDTFMGTFPYAYVPPYTPGPPAALPDGGPLVGLGQLPPGIVVVKQWVAGGVPFYRFSNGWIAVRRKDGTWKVYRPKRPIVLYPGAGNSRRSVMRAATILRAEDKANRALSKLFAPKAPRKPAKPRTIVLESGRGGVQVVE
jgi:hypothetical protein